MASIEDRWFRVVEKDDGTTEKVPTDRNGIGRRWLLRWRDQAKKECKLSFEKWTAANDHKKTIEADLLRGTYIDPKAGEKLFCDYFAEWLAVQTTDPLTRENIQDRVRRYVEPFKIYKTPLGRIKASVIQGWISGLPGNLAESTKGVVYSHVSAVLNAAVNDELIGKNPCNASSVRRPRADSAEIEPWPHEHVASLHQHLTERYRIVAVLGAGLGLRQGEIFGLSPDDVDFLRGWVTVQRQVKLVGARPVFALPKGRKVRKVPLPESVKDALAAHLAGFPAKAVTLPWEESDGKPTEVRLTLTSRQSGAVNRNNFNPAVWKPALVRAGIEPVRANGCHALRHHYASVLLDAGESIKTLSAYLGHSSAAFTLKTYTHMMPSSEGRTKRAINDALGGMLAAVRTTRAV